MMNERHMHRTARHACVPVSSVSAQFHSLTARSVSGQPVNVHADAINACGQAVRPLTSRAGTCTASGNKVGAIVYLA